MIFLIFFSKDGNFNGGGFFTGIIFQINLKEEDTTMKRMYFILAFFGFVIPYYFFVRFLINFGLDPV